MSLCNNRTLNTHTHCGSGFNASSPVPNKNMRSYLLLNQSVSLAGSIYNLGISHSIAFTEPISDFFNEIVADPISFLQTVSAPLQSVRLISDTFVVVDSFVYAGTAGAGTGGSTPIEAIFDSNTDKGMIVYIPSDGHADLAQGDAVGTSGAIGFAQEDVLATATGFYLTEGQVTKTDWTSITGTTLLVPGSVYFLSVATPGGMTTTPPSLTGESTVRVGRAATTEIFDIEISQPILL